MFAALHPSLLFGLLKQAEPQVRESGSRCPRASIIINNNSGRAKSAPPQRNFPQNNVRNSTNFNEDSGCGCCAGGYCLSVVVVMLGGWLIGAC